MELFKKQNVQKQIDDFVGGLKSIPLEEFDEFAITYRLKGANPRVEFVASYPETILLIEALME